MSDPDFPDLLDPDDDNLEYDAMEQPEENTYGDFQDAANQHPQGLHRCTGCGVELDGDDTNKTCGECTPVKSAAIALAEAADRVAEGAVIIDSSKAALALFVTAEGQVNIKSIYGNAQVAMILRQIADKADQRHREGKTNG